MLRYDKILDAITDPLHVIDREMVIRYTNTRYLEWVAQFGLPKDMIDKRLDAIAPFLPEQAWRDYNTVFQTGKTLVTEEANLIDGNTYYIEVSKTPIRDEQGTIECILTVLRDITDRRQAEVALRASEAKFRSIFTASPIGIELYDAQGLLVDANPRCLEIFGIAAVTDIAGFNLFDDPNVTEDVRTQLLQGRTVRYERRFDFEPVKQQQLYATSKAGTIDLDVLITPLNTQGGHAPQGYLVQVQDISDRKAAEYDLQESETNFRTFFNTINDFLFILDEQGNIEEFNQTVSHRLGYAPEDLIHQPVLMVHPENLREEAARIVADMLRGTRDYCPAPVISKTGTLIPVETYITRGVWNGKPALFGVSKDLSALKMSEEKFAKAFHNNPAIAGLSDLETGEYLEVNQTFYNKLGFTPEEVIGKKATEVLRLDLTFRDMVIQQLQTQGCIRNEEGVIYSKQGTAISVLLSAEIIELQNRLYNFTTAIDITERKQAEDTIRRLNEEQALLLDTMDAQVWYLNDVETYGLVNRAHAEFLGLRREDIEHKKLDMFLPNEVAEICKTGNMTVFCTQKTFHTEEWISNTSGEPRLIAITKTPKLNQEGQVDYVVCVGVDITDRKRAEDRLQATLSELKEANATKDKFFSIIAHDLKNAFVTVITGLDIVQKPEQYSPDELQQIFADLQSTAENQFALLNNLLEWARSQTGKIPFWPEQIPFAAFMRSKYALLNGQAQAKQIALIASIDPELAVYADSRMLSTIVWNLISNGIKFTYPGGTIEVSAQETQKGVEISVADTGVGMTQDALAQLFKIDSHYQTRGTADEKGTGLGLILCKEFVERHGGAIWAKSEVGKGTTFTFLLPKQ